MGTTGWLGFCWKTLDLPVLNPNNMFEQVVGDGANLFVTIVACLIGFAAAIGFQDYRKTKKEEESH